MEAFKKNLFPVDKINYLRGKRSGVKCILCSIVNKSKKTVNLTVFNTTLTYISVNLYPYSPGHLMLFPKRHITDIRKMTREEWLDMIRCIEKSISILKKAYKPRGFNIGMNMGFTAGASIRHIHWHIVPRYKNEVGFIDILSGTKIYVEHPEKTMKKLRKLFR